MNCSKARHENLIARSGRKNVDGPSTLDDKPASGEEGQVLVLTGSVPAPVTSIDGSQT